jgi:hypothetical protein
MVEPRLKSGDLVKVKRSMTFKGKKLKVKDTGVLLEVFLNNGFGTAKVFWQQDSSYSDDMPTEHLEKVA